MLSQKFNDNLVETLSDNFYYNLLLQSLDNRKHLNECNESHQEYLTVTFQLLREMIKSSRLRQRIMEKLELDFVLQTFRPITSKYWSLNIIIKSPVEDQLFSGPGMGHENGSGVLSIGALSI